MSDFNSIKHAVSNQIGKLVKIADDSELFEVQLDKDELWDLYLSSFPEGTDPVYKTRTEHNCNCCKQFIRNCGAVVAFKDGEMHTVWDSSATLDDHYGVVAAALAAYVKTKPVKNIFRHFQQDVGVDKSRVMADDKLIVWGHFHYSLPSKYYLSNRSVDTIKGECRTYKEVFQSSLEMIDQTAIDIVLELIAQNSLYRGEEHKRTLENLSKLKKAYAKLKTDVAKEAFLWTKSLELKEAGKFKTMVIGTLLTDLSKGIDIEDAVRMFESKVAPQNYKRSKALVTKGMIEEAEKTVADLGIEESLHRRYAVSTDITVNNVLFADRQAKNAMKGIFGEMKDEVKDKTPDFSKVEEVSISDFLSKILPTVNSVDVWVDNAQENNFASLIAPTNPDATRIFKWKNNFSWAYNGDVTDSIKERVKKAGGSVTGFLRCSLSWHNLDDLDIHIVQPNRPQQIYYANKIDSITKGTLDVDMNAGVGRSRTPVENVTWPDKDKLKEGQYKVIVNQFQNRENIDFGFEVEIECNGNTFMFAYDKAVPYKNDVEVAVFEYTHKNGIKIIRSIGEQSASKEIWGVTTQKFHRASMILKSPNYWDGENPGGNEHVFFILENCANPGTCRGFFNEYLLDALTPHRKVFEVLGSKLKVAESTDQLSGVGFSSTKKSEVICRVKGSFNRTVKVKF